MGTQDETNKAEPQNEFLSGFKLKNRAVEQNEEKQQPLNRQAEKKESDFVSKKTASGTGSRTNSNPYQLNQQLRSNSPMDQVDFEKDTGPGFVKKYTGKLFKGKSDKESSRQKVMVVMIPILFVVMVFLFRQVLSKPPQKTQGAITPESSTLDISKSTDNEIDWKIPDPIPVKIKDPVKTEQNTINNPGQENANGDSENGVIFVSSILYSNDKPSVVIGDKIVYLNQELNGAVVVEIHRDYIVFEKNGERWIQKVAEGIAQKSVEPEIK